MDLSILNTDQRAAFNATVAIWSTANPAGDHSAMQNLPSLRWHEVSDDLMDEFVDQANLGSDDSLVLELMRETEDLVAANATCTEVELMTKVEAVDDWRSEFKNRVLAHARALGWNPAVVAPTTPPAPAKPTKPAPPAAPTSTARPRIVTRPAAPTSTAVPASAAPVAPPPRTKALTPGVLDPQLAGIVGASLARYRSGLTAIERALLDLVATGKFDEAKRVVDFVRDHPGAYGGPECSELLLAFFQERLGLIMGRGDLQGIKERFGAT